MPVDRPRKQFSRRTLIVGGVGAVAALGAGAAFGIPAVSNLSRPPGGKLLTPLLASTAFTVAHRGGSADWPEMSAYAYAHSVDHHVDALEVSLARTSDGVWFGLHDKTLDRTSGTSAFAAAEHTWAEVSRHLITGVETASPDQQSRPYLRLDDLLASYAATHTIFIDPKWVRASFYPELLGMLGDASSAPAESFVAKFYGLGSSWAVAARRAGLTTWGYYYGKDVDADAGGISTTEKNWDLLGMDYGASAAAWQTALSFGKPVLGHVIPSRAAAMQATASGAAGLVVSGVVEVLG